MAINDMGIEQLSTVLNSIVAQAAGTAALANTDTSSFVSVARIGLQTGYDKLATAISQVLSKTIFSYRPYYRKLQVMEWDEARYGNNIRKLNIIDEPFVDDDRIKLVNGSSIDPWTVKKPSIVTTNYYGQNLYEKWVTIYRDQLDVAFSNASEFGQFLSMVMGNASDMLEQAYEETARATLVNLIGGTASTGVTSQVVHLVAEYNAATGQTGVTLAQLLAPDKFADFARWIFARIKTASKAMENRTTLFHQNPTTATPISGRISRHTPVKDQRLVLYEPFFNRVSTNVLSVSFNDEYLKTIPYEGVSFWQSMQTPEAINIKAGYVDTAGDPATAPFNSDLVLGVLFDRDAAGYVPVNKWSATSPFNPAGGYYNQYYHVTAKYICDNFENSVVFMLD